MPRFASRKSGSKTPSDIILKMKRLLAAAVTRHAKLQHESQQLHQEHELLQAVCGAFDWLRQQTGEDQEIVATAEELLLLQQVGQQAALPPTEAAQAAPNPGATDATQAYSSSYATANCNASQPDAAGQPSSHAVITGSGDGSSGGAESGEAGPSCAASLPASSSPAGWSIWSTPTAAPANDVMQLFKRIMSMEPSPVAETISLAELVTAYAGYVKELSLSCQLYEASTAAGSSSAVPQVWLQGMPPQDKIEDTMCRYLGLLLSLFKVKRQDLVQELCLTNCDTRQLLQEPVQKHYAWVMPQLGLTEDQQQRIATGVRVFKRILTPSLQELRQLQLEDQVNTPAAAPGQQQQQPSKSSSGSGATSGSCSMQTSGESPASMDTAAADSTAAGAAAAAGTHPMQSAAADAAAPDAAAGPAALLEAAAAPRAAMSVVFAPLSAAHVAYRQRLDEQERRSARIKLLLRKDFLHRICFCSYVYGCLSWPQQAKLHCLMWPYCPMVLVTSETIAQMAPQGPSLRPRGRPRKHPVPQ